MYNQYLKDALMKYHHEPTDTDAGLFHTKYSNIHNKLPHLVHADHLEETDRGLTAAHIREAVENGNVQKDLSSHMDIESDNIDNKSDFYIVRGYLNELKGKMLDDDWVGVTHDHTTPIERMEHPEDPNGYPDGVNKRKDRIIYWKHLPKHKHNQEEYIKLLKTELHPPIS
jgi:hypothetical protein